MEVQLESLIAIEQLLSKPESVLKAVRERGMVVILENNSPIYVIMNASSADIAAMLPKPKSTQMTLHEAMKLVLSETPDKTMHARDLAEEIYERGLYRQMDGGMAKYNQIRARCNNYQYLFEALPGNIIRLRSR